jgi:hypothetical protein
MDKRMQARFKSRNRKTGKQKGAARGGREANQQGLKFFFDCPGIGFVMTGPEVRKNHIQQGIHSEKQDYIKVHYQWLVEFVPVDKSKRLKDISQHHQNEGEPYIIDTAFAARQE